MAAKLESGDLIRTDFNNANLIGVKFGNSNPNDPYSLTMSEINFGGANLSGAEFFAHIELDKVNFRNAVMKNTRLYGVDLTRALNLSSTQKQEALSDIQTRWPL